MSDLEQAADIGPEPLPDVSISQAEEIIRAVLSRRRRVNFSTLDAKKLADGINSLRREYDVRHVMDSMATLKELETAYTQLMRASQALHGAIESIQKSTWAWYFLAILQQDPASSNDDEPDFAELNAAQVLTGRLAGYAEEALKEVDAARGPEGRERWYEHEERKAESWLYGHGLPRLYEEIFGSTYSISGETHDTRPGLRFAQAVLSIAGLPVTSPANLRKQARRVKARGVPARDA